MITRRNLLKKSALTGGAFYLSKLASCSDGANDIVNVAVVGFRGRGMEHISAYNSISGARVAALCDVNEELLNEQAAELKKNGKEVKTYTDIRKLLEDKDIDAISMATPNHWHALASIWAVQAGKDVYVEKPLSHNVWEGRQVVNAAKKYNRIVQTGSQIRSSEGIRDAVAWVQAGNLGKITLARGLCYKRRKSINQRKKPLPAPEGVDLDLWFGPAQVKEINRRRLDYDWHWQWDYGNGDLGNQGVHQMDVARWFLGEGEIAPKAWSVGGRLGYEDDGETPNTQIVYQAYEKAPLIFEVRGLPTAKDSEIMDKYMDGEIAVIIHCEGGHVLVPSYSEAIAFDKDGKKLNSWKGASDHFKNFIDAVRNKKPEELTAGPLDGHISAAICHTGNISHQVGKTASAAEIKQAIASSHGAEETFDRMVKHLEANGVDLNATPLTLGPVLDFDTKAETLIGNDAAAKLMTREYRAPFAVPEISLA